jgi:hypothetical protein
MNSQVQNPFETIESAQDFLRLLSTAISDAKLDLQSDVHRMGSSELSRRKDAIQITAYSLEKLEGHVKQSNRILNDLRTLRRLLFEERTWALSDKNGVTANEEWSQPGVAIKAAYASRSAPAQYGPRIAL